MVIDKITYTSTCLSKFSSDEHPSYTRNISDDTEHTPSADIFLLRKHQDGCGNDHLPRLCTERFYILKII
jgi:hypothetical protein